MDRCIDDVDLAPVASCVVGMSSIEVNALRNYPRLVTLVTMSCLWQRL